MAGTSTVERQDAHNISVDAGLAEQGHCATVLMPTGRRCILSAHHAGGCAFVHLEVLPETEDLPAPGAAADARLGCVEGR
jgi:hypothetical protein